MSFVLPSSVNLVDYSGRPWTDIQFAEKDGASSYSNKHGKVHTNQDMSFVLPSSVNLVDYSGQPWTDIEFTEKDGGSSSAKTSPKEYKATRLLPRTYNPLFGQFPKLEPRVLLECDKCGKVLLPSVYTAHYNHPDHKNMQPVVQQQPVTSKTSNRNRKSATKPSTSFASTSSASSSQNNNVMLMVSKHSTSSNVTPPVPVPVAVASTTPATTSNGRSSKHKKSSKSNKRSRKEEKSEPVHPIVLQAVQSPEARPAKVIKQDSEHLVAIATSSLSIPNSPPTLNIPEQILTTNTPPPLALLSLPVNEMVEVMMKDEILDLEPIATSTTVSMDVSPPAFINLASELSTMPNHVISNQMETKMIEDEVDVNEEPTANDVISVSSLKEEQDNSPVDHLPMSPVAVVKIVPMQNYQYLQQYLQLPTQPIVVTIPCTSPSTHMYSSYPKPLTVTTRAIRKIGNTYLLQNQRMDHQRAEIQAITRSRQEYSNANTLNHLPT